MGLFYINRKNLTASFKKNRIDFLIPSAAGLYAYFFGLGFKIEYHRSFFIFAIYLFPILIVAKIFFDANRLGKSGNANESSDDSPNV